MHTSSNFVAAEGDGYEQLMGRWSRRLAEPFLDFVGTRNMNVRSTSGAVPATLPLRWPPTDALPTT